MRAPRVCAECTALVYGGARCPEHAKQPWSGPRTESSRRTGTRRWQATRRQILNRDGGRCRARLPGCTLIAIEVHHLDQLADNPHDEHPHDRLISVCKPCHTKLTAADNAPTARASRLSRVS